MGQQTNTVARALADALDDVGPEEAQLMVELVEAQYQLESARNTPVWEKVIKRPANAASLNFLKLLRREIRRRGWVTRGPDSATYEMACELLAAGAFIGDGKG